LHQPQGNTTFGTILRKASRSAAEEEDSEYFFNYLRERGDSTNLGRLLEPRWIADRHTPKIEKRGCSEAKSQYLNQSKLVSLGSSPSFTVLFVCYLEKKKPEDRD
jgi:hypothetical protein